MDVKAYAELTERERWNMRLSHGMAIAKAKGYRFITQDDLYPEHPDGAPDSPPEDARKLSRR